MKTTFYIVRHGETIGNTKKIIQGHTDTELTEKGIEQAHAIREELSHINFAAAYSSDLGRAITTAEIFLKDKKIPYKTSPLIRERCFGKYETGLYRAMVEANQEFHDLMETLPHEKRRTTKLSDDIECDAELWERFSKFISETAPKYSGKNILVISHGGFMKALLLELHYDTYENNLKARFGNTGYIKLSADESGIAVDEVKGFTVRE
ncbi:MAG: histidine phosphatase family protein [Ignavibacteria bacterium]|nr:histidine phosphatase family protein [Ignavibacteria bacterium]